MRPRPTALGFVMAALSLAAPAALAEQLPWETELREMGYSFLHISNINAVNGLNLTRSQAMRLRDLALQVEAAAPRPPSLAAPASPEWAAVRKDWLELRALLLAGKPVPEELANRVNLGRATESKLVRATLRPAPTGQTTACATCHVPPSSASGQPMATGPTVKRLTDLAHCEGIYGKAGFWKLLQLSPQVEAVLTEPQKAILGRFACCLVPPQDLSDPVRAGQADSPEKALDLLRRVRACPEALWPMMRAGVLSHVDYFTAAVSPAADAARKSAAREAVAKALDRARACSDVEFELEKDHLSKAVKEAIIPAPAEGPHKAAYFLLIPGASKVYAAYLARLTQKN